MSESRRNYKVLLVGSSRAGKSTIVANLLNRVVTKDYMPTIGIDFGILQDENIVIQLWDTAGEQPYDSRGTLYVKHTDLIVCVIDPFSITFGSDLSRLEETVRIADEVNGHTVPRLLIATKSDFKSSAELASLKLNLATFKLSLANASTAKPLHISGLDPAAKQIILPAIIKQLPVPVSHSTENVLSVKLIDDLNTLKEKLAKRFFKPDISRTTSIDRLLIKLNNAPSSAIVKAALIEEARFLRTPDEFGRNRFGINIGSTHFKFFVHFRSYEHSTYYQFLKNELYKMDALLDLAQASEPQKLEAAAPRQA